MGTLQTEAAVRLARQSLYPSAPAAATAQPRDSRAPERALQLPEPEARSSDLATVATLLYRYFFFDWLFRDVGRGSRIERAAAWRHNQRQARWLPTYMRRWLVCGGVLYACGGYIEAVLGAPLASALFYVPSVLTVSVNAVIVAAWAGLRALPGPV